MKLENSMPYRSYKSLFDFCLPPKNQTTLLHPLIMTGFININLIKHGLKQELLKILACRSIIFLKKIAQLFGSVGLISFSEWIF